MAVNILARNSKQQTATT